MQYRIVPIEKINNDPRVAKLCELLGYGKVAQNTAQAATWHMANGLGWDELAHKNRVESKYTGNVRFFNGFELQNAFRLAALINHEFAQYTDTSGSSGYQPATDSE
jgi:hypothetical protein